MPFSGGLEEGAGGGGGIDETPAWVSRFGRALQALCACVMPDKFETSTNCEVQRLLALSISWAMEALCVRLAGRPSTLSFSLLTVMNNTQHLLEIVHWVSARPLGIRLQSHGVRRSVQMVYSQVLVVVPFPAVSQGGSFRKK